MRLIIIKKKAFQDKKEELATTFLQLNENKITFALILKLKKCILARGGFYLLIRQFLLSTVISAVILVFYLVLQEAS